MPRSTRLLLLTSCLLLAAESLLAAPPRERNRAGRTPDKVKPGDFAPDFTLPKMGEKKSKITLSSFRGKQPVALVFGSYT